MRAAQDRGRRPGRAAGRRRRRHAGPQGDRPGAARRRPLGARRGRRARQHAPAPSTRPLRDVVLAPDLAAAPRARRRTHPSCARSPPTATCSARTRPPAARPRRRAIIEVQAAVDEARAQPGRRPRRGSASCASELEAARASVAAGARRRSTVAAAAKREAEGERNAAARRLAELGAAARSAQGRGRAARRRPAPRPRRPATGTSPALAELEERLRLAEATPVDDGTVHRGARPARRGGAAGPAERDGGAARGPHRRGAGRARSPAGPTRWPRQAAAEREARERAAARRAARARGAAIAQAVVVGAARGAGQASRSRWPTAGRAPRRASPQARTAREAELAGGPRPRPSGSAAELERLTSEVHRDEVARAEQRMRIEQLEAKAAEEFGARRRRRWSPSTARTQPVPPTARRGGRGRGRRASRRRSRCRSTGPTQEKRAAKAERDLALLGKVNPLALEEFAALEERFKFLSDQLEDLKATRRDLLTVVKDVDDRILEVFTSAYEDTAREFEQVFAVLFPGGEGRLVLTDPEDMLTTGVEVEARPPGKKIKRLSLLSGGERSLTAVAHAVRDLPGPAQPVLHHGRGRGGARRRQPRPADHADGAAAGEEPADHHHAPEAHHGGRRRALRRDHAQRRDRGDQPAAEPRTED